MKHGTLTKKELLEKLKDIPDDMPILRLSGMGFESVCDVNIQNEIANADEPDAGGFSAAIIG